MSDQLAAGAPVLIYCRISPGHGDDNVSLEAMEAECRAFCAQRGWCVVAVVSDDRISGKSVDDRPGFSEVLAQARHRPPAFRAVVFWKQSRVFRNVEEFYAYRAVLRRSGVQLVSVKEPLPGGALGEAMAGILAIVDQLYTSQIAEDTRRNLKHLVSQGYWPGGRPPVGGRLEKVVIGRGPHGEEITRTRLVPDPQWAPRVLQAFEMDDRGVKGEEIVAVTRICANTSALKDILVNETYGDHLVYNRRRQAGGKNRRLRNESAEQVIGQGHGLHIVPQDLLERVIARRAARKRGPLARIQSPYLLSDVLVCACGGRIRGDGRRGVRQYACVRRRLPSCGLAKLPADELEALVLSTLRDDIGSLEQWRAAWRTVERSRRRGTAEGKEHLAELRAALAQATVERESYWEAIRQGVHARHLAVPLAAVSERIEDLEREIAAVTTPAPRLVITDELARETRDVFLRRLGEQPADVLRELIDRVEVDGPHRVIRFHLSGAEMEDSGGTAYRGPLVSSTGLPALPGYNGDRSLPAGLVSLQRPGPKRPRTHKAAALRNAEMIARRAQGEPLRVLAADYGIGIQRVSYICRRGR